MRDPSRGHGSHALYQGPTLSRAANDPRLTALAAEVRFSRPIGRSHLSPQLLSPQTIGKTYLRGATESAKMRDPSRGHGSHALYQGPTLSRAANDPRLTALAAEVRFSRPIGRSHLSPQLLSPQTIGKTYLRGATESAKMRDPSRGHGSHALYQGPTLVGPQMAPALDGFSR